MKERVNKRNKKEGIKRKEGKERKKKRKKERKERKKRRREGGRVAGRRLWPLPAAWAARPRAGGGGVWWRRY